MLLKQIFVWTLILLSILQISMGESMDHLLGKWIYSSSGVPNFPNTSLFYLTFQNNQPELFGKQENILRIQHGYYFHVPPIEMKDMKNSRDNDPTSFYLWVQYRGGPWKIEFLQDRNEKAKLHIEIAPCSSWLWVNCGKVPIHLPMQGIRVYPISNQTLEIKAILLVQHEQGHVPTVIVESSGKKQVSSFRKFGTNGFQGIKPHVMENEKYQQQLRYLNPGIFRFHSGETLSLWMGSQEPFWNYELIRRVFTTCPLPSDRLMVNIVSWPPSWTLPTPFLPREKWDDFARFCSDLVEFLNIKEKRHIPYWEITNEMDDRYGEVLKRKGEPEKIDELASLFVHVAQKMKVKDPSIKTGGPAAALPWNIQRMKKFTELALPYLDFLSIHLYASGSAEDPNWKILQAPDSFAWLCKELRLMLDQVSPHRKIELHVNEYNISWTWETRDPRMRNMIGAIFDALVMALCAPYVDAFCSWNECDGIYGKMDHEYQLRPAAHVQAWFSQYGIGEQIECNSDEPGAIIPYLTEHLQKYYLIIINRDHSSRYVHFQLQSCKDSFEWGQQLTEQGITSRIVTTKPNIFLLPPYSVTLLEYNSRLQSHYDLIKNQ